jgi:hypothetical protein
MGKDIKQENNSENIKILKMSWYQMRRGIGGELPTHIYQQKKVQLEEFQRLDE